MKPVRGSTVGGSGCGEVAAEPASGSAGWGWWVRRRTRAWEGACASFVHVGGRRCGREVERHASHSHISAEQSNRFRNGKYGRRDETCPFSTEGGTRRVQLVRDFRQQIDVVL